MSSSDPSSDTLYQQFKQWQEQNGYKPPDYFADPQQQQFDLFQQLLAFQQWHMQQGGQAPTTPSAAVIPPVVPSQSLSAQSPSVSPPPVTASDAWHAEAQQLVGALSQLAAHAQARPAGETAAERSARLEREFQELMKPDGGTSRMKVFEVTSQGDPTIVTSTVREEHFPSHYNVNPPQRRSRLWPLLIAALVVVALVASSFMFFGNTDSGSLIFASATLEVSQYTSYSDSGNDLHIVGLVKNTGTATTNGVQIDAVLRDSKGRAADSGSDNTLYNAPLAPGQSSGFDISIFSPPTKWDKLEVKATERKYKSNMVSGLIVSSTAITPTNNGYTVSGTVNNKGADDARSARVVVTLYDAAGKVLAVGSTISGSRDGIDAGQSAPFSVSIYRSDIRVDHFDTYVFGEQK